MPTTRGAARQRLQRGPVGLLHGARRRAGARRRSRRRQARPRPARPPRAGPPTLDLPRHTRTPRHRPPAPAPEPQPDRSRNTGDPDDNASQSWAKCFGRSLRCPSTKGAVRDRVGEKGVLPKSDDDYDKTRALGPNQGPGPAATAAAVDADALKPGTLAGAYVLKKELASGGGGTVYEAHHRILGRARGGQGAAPRSWRRRRRWSRASCRKRAPST